MAGLGTAINVATVIGGTGVGLLAGGRLPERTRVTMLQGVGLVVIGLGLSETLKTHNIVFPLVAIVIGALVGEALRIEDRLEQVGARIQRRVERPTPVDLDAEAAPDAVIDLGADADAHSSFIEGFVVASLIFCVGPLAILGSIQDGLSGDVQLLVVKSALDGLVSIVFAATLGWGVGFSALTVLVYQGALTIAAGGVERVLSDRMILEATAAGGIMIVGIGLRLLDIKQVRVASLLPALVICPVLVGLFAR